MAIGTVKWYNSKKGYGFIVPDQSGDDVFFHVSALKEAGIDDNSVREGDRFEYEIKRDPRKQKSAAASMKRL